MMMWYVLLAAVVAAPAVADLSAGLDLNAPLARDCDGVPCPTYTILNQTDDYQLRQFDDMNWLRTRMQVEASPSSPRFWSEVDEGVEKLEGYFAGQNELGWPLPRMTPLLFRVCEPANLCDIDISIYLFGDLFIYPQPSDPLVELATMSTIPVYVRGFNPAYEDRIQARRDNMKALKAALKRDGASYYAGTEHYAIFRLDPVSGYEEVGLVMSQPEE